jgi:adenine phosphoribosyltransferase
MSSRKWLDYPRPGMPFPDLEGSNTSAENCSLLIERFVTLMPPEASLIGGIDVGGGALAGGIAMMADCGFMTIRKIEAMKPEMMRMVASNYHLGNGVALARGHDVDGKHVVLVDDIIMTGETALAAVNLLRDLGARVETALFMFAMEGMGGLGVLADAGVSGRALKRLPQP